MSDRARQEFLSQRSTNKELNGKIHREIKSLETLITYLFVDWCSFRHWLIWPWLNQGNFLSLIFRLKIELIFQSENSCDQPDHQMDAEWNWDETKSYTIVSAIKSWRILHNQLKMLKIDETRKVLNRSSYL